MDRQVIGEKLESLRRCVQRVADKTPMSAAELSRDPDVQDVVALNLMRAVQVCVDIAAHITAEDQLAPPAAMGESFDRLAQQKVIDPALAQRMRKAVGFRNIAVHNYQAVDWAIVHSICKITWLIFARLRWRSRPGAASTKEPLIYSNRSVRKPASREAAQFISNK